ncbi:hypothetical protein BDZ85DRAFT_60138 [Elsinoe ampelina]|uniref:Uncharacterized protein n=1 Tax=Elsinoe ampelina TaxID=302913 RepID=A0A6A6G019_9PEZI|nr:hypothetical protein BDZ85DRAFT_60138 [Elsinoe ampelina]
MSSFTFLLNLLDQCQVHREDNRPMYAYIEGGIPCPSTDRFNSCQYIQRLLPSPNHQETASKSRTALYQTPDRRLSSSLSLIHFQPLSTHKRAQDRLSHRLPLTHCGVARLVCQPQATLCTNQDCDIVSSLPPDPSRLPPIWRQGPITYLGPVVGSSEPSTQGWYSPCYIQFLPPLFLPVCP